MWALASRGANGARRMAFDFFSVLCVTQAMVDLFLVVGEADRRSPASRRGREAVPSPGARKVTVAAWALVR